MPRPFKCRFVEGLPPSDYFKPRGIPLSDLEVVNLTVDEFEAVRLADYEGLYQEKAAEKMGISRPTFGNIVESARKKIADALVNSRAIRIEGGVYRTPDGAGRPARGRGNGGGRCRWGRRAPIKPASSSEEEGRE
jgi:predicted DNA-binding protein (UPF0251 family)